MEEMIGTVTGEEGCSFLDLPRNVATGILSRLGDTPKDIVSFGRSCRAAHSLACEPALWQQLCCTLSKAFHDPGAWHAHCFQHLYLALVYPYRDLLLCKLWHSNLWPCGCVLCIDAEPPRLVARSLHYKTLNGGPFCHEKFFVGLQPAAADQPAAQGKAAAYLSSCSGAEQQQQQQQKQLAAPLSYSRPIKLLPYPKGNAAAAAAVVPSSPGALAAGFVFGDGGTRTSATYMALHESLDRHNRHLVKPYAEAAQQQDGSNSGTSRVAGSCSSSSGSVQQQLPVPDVAPVEGISPPLLLEIVMDVRRQRDKLTLPVFKPFKLQPWLMSAATSSKNSVLAAMPGTKGTAAAAAAAAAADIDAALLYQLPGLFKGAYGSHGVELVQLQLAAVAAAAAHFNPAASSRSIPAAVAAASFVADTRNERLSMFPGTLLQGLIGLAGQPEVGPSDVSSGGLAAEYAEAELLAELASGLEAPEDDDGWAQEVVDAQEVAGMGDDDDDELDWQYPESDVGTDDEQALAGLGVQDAADAEAEPAAEGEAAAAAAAAQEEPTDAGEAAAGTAAGADAGTMQQLPPQLLLVGTKVLGDVNVPAGHVSFAFDANSRSLEGAGQPLQLPPDISVRVDISKPGVRQLIVQERYRGRAQIASSGFQQPATVAAELLLFGPDCFGVVWGAPLSMFSLFSRVEDAAALPAARTHAGTHARRS